MSVSASDILDLALKVLPAPSTVVSHLVSLTCFAAFIALALLAYWNKVHGSCELVLHSVSPHLRIVSGRSDLDSARPPSVWTLREYLDVMCPALKTPFRPTWYLPIGHLQTFYASIQENDHLVDYYRDMIATPDGGQIAVDWAKPMGDAVFTPTTPTVVILHGLTGGSHEAYVQELGHYLGSAPRQIRCVVVNFRGCAGTELLTPQLYNGAYTDDFRLAMRHIRKVIPDAKLAAVGFSLGSNVLVKFLGEEGENAPFVAAASVCNPFDFLKSSLHILSTPVTRVYSRALAGNLKTAYARHQRMLTKHPRVHHGKVMAARHIWEFDDRVTRVLGGYLTVEDYYNAASSSNYISRVRVPLFCLNALDDPISPIQSIPFSAADDNPYVVIGTTRLGGHVAHFEGTRPTRWSTKVYGEYLVAMLHADQVSLVGGPKLPRAVSAAAVEVAAVSPPKPAVSVTGRDSAIADMGHSSASGTDSDGSLGLDQVVEAEEEELHHSVPSAEKAKKPEPLRPAPPVPRLIGPQAVLKYYGNRVFMLPLVRWIVRYATGSRALAVVLMLLGLRRAMTTARA
ncbi:Alpha/Beta hydrolase protein [Blastocladiella britannica]|nr:Alpha/Beta hydrolase protein [Blastocladiella britannica]